MYLKEGGGQCIERWGTVKTLKFKKGGGCMPPPAPMVAPPLDPGVGVRGELVVGVYLSITIGTVMWSVHLGALYQALSLTVY